MTDCAVQQEVIVVTRHSPFSASFSSVRFGLGKRRRAEILVALNNPTEYAKYAEYVKYVIYDNFKYKGNILVENALFKTQAKMSLQLWINSFGMKNVILEYRPGQSAEP